MTDAEKRLWQRLRSDVRRDGTHFRRQVALGPYIVDFVCLRHRLIVEVDGQIHATSTDFDRKREAWLKAEGYRVVRFSNQEVVLRLDNVVKSIAIELAATTPTPNPSPHGGGELRAAP